MTSEDIISLLTAKLETLEKDRERLEYLIETGQCLHEHHSKWVCCDSQDLNKALMWRPTPRQAIDDAVQRANYQKHKDEFMAKRN